MVYSTVGNCDDWSDNKTSILLYVHSKKNNSVQNDNNRSSDYKEAQWTRYKKRRISKAIGLPKDGSANLFSRKDVMLLGSPNDLR